MNLKAVMVQVGQALSTVPGLRVYDHPVLKVEPPAAIVSYPESLEKAAGYGPGVARMVLPVVVMVGRPTDRTTQDRITKYADGSGTSSIARIMDAYAWTACHHVTVVGIDFDVVTMAGNDYLAAAFTLDIIGSGT